MIPTADFEARVAAVRRFARFYTRRIGLLQESLLQSPFSLSQARVLYELAHCDRCTASDLASALGLDHGYLSRILRGFAEEGLIVRNRSAQDGRQISLSLTVKGRKAFAALDHHSQREMGGILKALPVADQERVVAAMGTIENLIDGGLSRPPAYLLRPHRPGDMGWVISSQMKLYAAEYGWDASYEALVAEITAQFLRNFDPAREHCWIAEIGGEPVGSVFLVKAGEDVAKLRLLGLEAKARGLGIGRRLVGECISFAREKGYSKMTLWTQSILKEARGIYQRAGFRLVKSERHRSFGHDLVGETWELDL